MASPGCLHLLSLASSGATTEKVNTHQVLKVGHSFELILSTTAHTHLYLWLVFSLVFVLLQRFLELLHLLCLFAFPPLLLPPLTTLLIAQTFALEFPPPSLFFLLLPESLKNIKTKCVRPAFSNVYTSRPELIYLFILQEVQQRSCFFSLNKGNDKNYSFCSAFV